MVFKHDRLSASNATTVESSGGVEPTGLSLDTEDVDTGEPQVTIEDPVPAASSVGVPKARRPWLSAQTRWEMGRTPGCKGCEAIVIIGQSARPHSQECWDRTTGILESTEDGKATLARSKQRMEQYQSIIAHSVTPDASSIPAPPLAVAHWPAEGEAVGDEDSDDEGASPLAPTGAASAGSAPANADASIDAVYARYISCKPDGTVTKEGIRQVFERFDKEQFAKAERQNLKVSHKKTDNDASEIYSPLA